MKRLPSQQVLKELLDYCPITGLLTWRSREPSHFTPTENRSAEHIAKNWNSDNAGKLALNSPAKHGYREGSIFSKRCFAHRVIWKWMTGEDPIEIDHVDGNGSNNQWDNLRSVGMKLNSRNTRLSTRNMSGVIGVSWKPTLGKWRVRCMVNGKDIHVGLFMTLEEAAAARKEFDKKHGFHPNHGRKLA